MSQKYKNSNLALNWRVGFHSTQSAEPESWFPATIPGAVQLDYARAFAWPPYWVGDNFKDYAWMEDAFWTYRTLFSKSNLTPDQQLFLISKGIDYQFSITLNSQEIYAQEGMFKPVEIDLTAFLGDSNDLRITVFPAPKSQQKTRDKSQANQSLKPAVSYGWDWHPRLIPLGIWDETCVAIVNKIHLKEIDFDYTLSDDLASADVTVTAQGSHLDGCLYRYRLIHPGGMCVVEKEGMAFDMLQIKYQVHNIALWWPHDHGTPILYTSELEIWDHHTLIDVDISKIGFRRVRLVMNEGAWDEPSQFPKSRSVPPIQLEINGHRIFAKGSNWVPPDIFPGLITSERYEELLDLAVEAHLNILRVWGGGTVNKESFYKICDEKGILVWQDFPLACNDYAASTAFLKVLESEATAIIKRLRQHPCLVLWCGGNELFNDWSGMTDQSLPLRLLNSLCYQLDPATPFIPTTPLMGMGHGHYVFRDQPRGEEVFQIINRSKKTAYTEFGVPSPSALEVLKSFMPEDELWPPTPGGVWEAHHAYNAWQGNTWLMQDVIEFYFGACDNLEQLIEWGQLLQCEGYKAIYEEARRQKPYCSMALNWCYNEPWPTAANNSLLNWPLVKKPAYTAVKQACRPVLASARLSKFIWRAGEEFSCHLYILNDSYETLAGGSILAELVGDTSLELYRWHYPVVAPNTNVAGPIIRTKLPQWQSRQFTLTLRDTQNDQLNSSYRLILAPCENK
ncbi:hypothetical protein JXA70_00695 [candidate division KSB1 bacterium]|nr:hypothetical protein [candidate division KSB1 bacterium]